MKLLCSVNIKTVTVNLPKQNVGFIEGKQTFFYLRRLLCDIETSNFNYF